jgi:hypothetical protein
MMGLRRVVRVHRRLQEPGVVMARCFSFHGASGAPVDEDLKKKREQAGKYKGHTFPELLEHWSRERFKQVGVVLAGGAGLATLGTISVGAHYEQAILLDAFVALYWYQGLKDIRQTTKAIPHNFPVLGNLRYLLESFRPEIRQYFVEADDEATPYDRAHRAMVYQRAKNATDTLPLGTRRDVYKEGYEWIGHSMFPKHMDEVRACAQGEARSVFYPRPLAQCKGLCHRHFAAARSVPLTLVRCCLSLLAAGEHAVHDRRS